MSNKNSEKTYSEEVKQQLEFTEWLKRKGLYDPMASSRIMLYAYAIWKELKKDYNDIIIIS